MIRWKTIHAFSDAGERTVIGSHYAGPTWESTSGSKVVGAVQDRCTPDPNAIPWLLLKAISTVGQGVFSGITLIQRVNTSGGNRMIRNETINFSHFPPLPVLLVSLTLLVLSLGAAIEANAGEATPPDSEPCRSTVYRGR